MKHRYFVLPVLLLAAVALTVGPAFAARPLPVPEAIHMAPQHLAVAQPAHVNVVCQLGVTGDPAWVINYLAPPSDAYYTLLDPAACGCTNPGGVLLSTAHALLYFQTLACSIPVSVSIVAADMSDPTCPVPLPGQVICAPVGYTLTAPSLGLWDFSMALDAGCCITTKAFLKIDFLGAGTCTTLPKLVTTDGCEPCVSWNGYPPSYMDELCDVGFPGNLNMYVDAACCDVVPVQGNTWGRLKTLYR
jgi:hypothetical protein